MDSFSFYRIQNLGHWPLMLVFSLKKITKMVNKWIDCGSLPSRNT